MARVAAVDCGTNSIRLLVADVDPATGRLVDVDRRMEVVRLGQDVDRTGRLAADAVERTLAATRRYASVIAEHGVERVRFVATSATRDAANAAEFADGVAGVLGVRPEVVTGQDEARLSFAGASAGIAGGGPTLVVDLGGGSTELVLGEDGTVVAAHSMDVGCVRMTERHLADDPPTPGQLAAATADVDAALAAAMRQVAVRDAATLVGVAGTVTTITAHALGLDRYDPERIHATVLPADDVLAACAELLAMGRTARAALPYMHPGRVDVIGAGALVWSRVVATVRAEAGLDRVTTSEHDILDGIALSMV
jgi:exopolyphosphatase/guanosine-5'-triphosphate,3'-diphosphate pyrophosphatase